jgi:hypothetical protein
LQGPRDRREGFDPYDFNDFHRRILPERLAAGNGALAAVDVVNLDPIAFQVGDASYTYLPRDGGIDVLEGDAEAKVVVGLDPLFWQGLTHDLESAPGLLYPGRVRKVRGDMLRFVRWEPSLRAMFHGRPIFDPEHGELPGFRGGALDEDQSFSLADDPEEMAHYLRTAGFLRVRGVLDAEEVERFRGYAARQWKATASPGGPRMTRATWSVAG